MSALGTGLLLSSARPPPLGGWVGFPKWVGVFLDFWGTPPPLGCLHTGTEGAAGFFFAFL